MLALLIVFFLLIGISNAPAEVICKTQVIRGQDYIESVFFDGDKEVARVKQSPSGVISAEGEIPDGPVNFVDSYKKTHGEESYRSGKKHGYSRTFYENEKLKKESYYMNGQLLMEKEYYPDGKLRFEVDYSDARDGVGSNETGIGKLYHQNGALKYEWNFTRSSPEAFRKTYTQEGVLRFATYYDSANQLIKTENLFAPAVPEQPVILDNKQYEKKSENK